MAGKENYSINFNSHLSSILLRFGHLEDTIKGIKALDKELLAIQQVHENMRTSLELLKQIQCNMQNISRSLGAGKNSISRFKIILEKNIELLQRQRSSTIENRSFFSSNISIMKFIQEYENDSSNNWITGCYLFHFSNAFRAKSKTPWTKVNLFLEQNPQFIPSEIEKKFSYGLVRSRVNRYLSLCKKLKINPQLNYFTKFKPEL